MSFSKTHKPINLQTTMKPVSLTIEGLYSYQQRQTIDFEKLCEAHIFGIFGGVGSGKSSILEAIVFSLYGRTDRLNISGDNRTYNMLNLKSNKLFIEFLFESGQDNTKYKTVVSGKRNSKRFDDVQKFDHKCFVQTNGEWNEIELNAIENAIGLNYENFKRTVIIPQGQFQEFLQLGDTDRTKMMKELFNLNKYDLSLKTKLLENKNQEKLDFTRGQLDSIGEVSAELIKENEEASVSINKEISEIQKSLTELQNREKNLSQLKEKHQSLATIKEKLATLNEKKEEFFNREIQLNKFTDCTNSFKELLNKKQEKEQTITTTTNQLNQANSSSDKLNIELQSIKNQLAKIEVDYNNLDKIASRISDLENCADILEKETLKKASQERLTKGASVIEHTKQKAETIGNEIAECNTKVANLHQKDTNIERLSKIKEWFTIKTNITTRQNDLSNRFNDFNNKANTINKDIADIFTSSATNSKTISEAFTEIKNSVIANENKLKEVEKQLQQKLIEEHLGEVSRSLTPGTPCPLCGSEHHPNKWTAENFNTEIKQLKQTKEELLKSIDLLRKSENRLVNLDEKLNDNNKESNLITKQISALNEEEKTHSENFSWGNSNDFTPELITEQIQQAQKNLDSIKAIEKEKLQKENLLKTEVANLEKFQKATDDIQNEINRFTTETELLKSRIKNIDSFDFNRITSQEIAQETTELKQKQKYTQEKFSSLTEQNVKIGQQLAGISGEITVLNKSLQTTTAELSQTETLISKSLEKSDYSTIDQVKEILNLQLDIKKEKIEIDYYNKELFALEKDKNRLETELKDSSFDINELVELAETINSVNQNLADKQKVFGEISNQLKQLNDSFNRQKELHKEYILLQNRAEDIKTLKSLFSKNGFVDFISSTYLQNIVMAANNRFYKLTNQKLRLELSDDNKFLVRDYLNGGQIRNIKTLSGGQTFQAALCLALALSDNIQKHCGTGQSFFFLDEGFGSLDKQSLNIVFDALKSLRKENRIVGVISHVEEMQQEISAHLSIENHPETGSVIKTNW